MSEDKYNDVADFLATLSTEYRENKLTSDQVTLIDKFYCNYMAQSYLDKDSQTDEISEDELIEFLVMGWYVYSSMSKMSINNSNS